MFRSKLFVKAVIVGILAYTLGLILLASLSALRSPHSIDCPPQGNSTRAELQALDILKNRTAPTSAKTTAGEAINLSDFFRPGNDTQRFNVTQYATISGYVVKVKYGEAETCNCHSSDKTTWDYHIELSDQANLTISNKHILICEVTRYNRCIDYKTLQSWKGKKVSVSGYLFYDQEHKDAAETTNPGGAHNWRWTCWELHPVCKISLLSN